MKEAKNYYQDNGLKIKMKPQTENSAVRYSLKCKFSAVKDGKKLIFIGMNPSRTNEQSPDETIKQVIEYAAKENKRQSADEDKYQKIIFLNTLPLRKSHSKKLRKKIKLMRSAVGEPNEELRKELLANWKVIRKVLKKAVKDDRTEFLLATGNPVVKRRCGFDC